MTVPTWNTIEQMCFHNNPKCPSGKKIKPEQRNEGTGKKTLCPNCAKLNAEGK